MKIDLINLLFAIGIKYLREKQKPSRFGDILNQLRLIPIVKEKEQELYREVFSTVVEVIFYYLIISFVREKISLHSLIALPGLP